jgi:enoyl-CoA hydratase
LSFELKAVVFLFNSKFKTQNSKLLMLSFDLRDSIALIQFNRPEKLNALTGAMMTELSEWFESSKREPTVRAVILTGAGEEAFSVGTDQEELSAIGVEETRLLRERGHKLCALIEGCGVPVIAAINGLASGGGFELALACHIRLASTAARFNLSGIEFGVQIFFAQPQGLDAADDARRATELILAGAQVSAEDAQCCGLVNRVVSPTHLLAEAESLAREISQLAPVAISACLEVVTRGINLPLAEGLELETELFGHLFKTEDMREGTRAFLEKRPPVFKGK